MLESMFLITQFMDNLMPLIRVTFVSFPYGNLKKLKYTLPSIQSMNWIKFMSAWFNTRMWKTINSFYMVITFMQVMQAPCMFSSSSHRKVIKHHACFSHLHVARYSKALFPYYITWLLRCEVRICVSKRLFSLDFSI